MEMDIENLGKDELQERLKKAEDNLSELERNMQRDLRSTQHPNLHTAIRKAYTPKLIETREEITAYRTALSSYSNSEA